VRPVSAARLLAAISAAASAGAPPAAADSAAPARAAIHRSLGLAPGDVELRLVAEASLRARALARPLSLAPDAWLGVAPRWTIGVVHSRQSVGLVGPGATLCVRSPSPEICPRRYSGSGLEVRWSWREGALALAPRAQLLLRGVDPWKPAVTGGAVVRWVRGRLAISGDPSIRIGLASRDRGNRAALVVPVRIAVRPAGWLALALHTGWRSDLAVIEDGWQVPAALALEVSIGARVVVGGEAGLASAWGPQIDAKERFAALWMSWRRGVRGDEVPTSPPHAAVQR
jgi:hypothetical protein